MESNKLTSKTARRPAGWRTGAVLCGMVFLLCRGQAFAVQSTELAGAGGGVFPAGTTFNGVFVSGLRFGFGVDLAVTSGVAGTFEFTILGLSATGQPQIITIEGTATGGSGTAGSGATVLGTTRVDMGDGTPPSTGLPFVLAVTAGAVGQGTLEMSVNATPLPLATVNTGTLTVAPCRPDLPTLLTDALCAISTGGGLIGHNWISLPSYTNLKTAKDLCAALGPNALSVTQRFPDSASPGTTVGGTWTFDCKSQTCTPGSASTPPFEAACATACFCVNPGEGYDVVVGAPTSFQVQGCESRVPITLPAGSDTYLVSVPIATNLHTFQDLATAVGMPSTGLPRGTITGVNACTGLPVTCSAGTAACNTILLSPGSAYRLRFTNTNGTTFVNPTTSTAQCPPPC